jgi:predicted Ser/Thr protein kinase
MDQAPTTGGLDNLPERPTEAPSALSPDLAVKARRADVRPHLPLSGVLADRYQIIGPVGTGGFGTVFSAKDLRLDRPVAIKCLLRDSSAGREDLRHEASVVARLRHQNLPLVFDVQTAQGVTFLVMEWIDGLPLDGAWNDSLKHRIACLAEVASGLAELHRAGLIHGDLKPSNILVDRDGRIRIVDFGLARASGPRADGRFCGGTPGFSAPELFDQATSPGPEADVWSLGALLYLAMTGRPPFRGNASDEILEASRAGPPPLPEAIVPGCPPDLQRICLVALEQLPTARYVDADEFLADLHRFIRKERVLARPSVLETGFSGGLLRQAYEYEEWQRLGLITRQEAAKAQEFVGRLMSPESEWIVETRRLTIDLVALYVGCWLLVLGVALGLQRAWSSLGSLAVPAGFAVVLTLGVLACVSVAMRTRRLALALCVSAILAIVGFLHVWFSCAGVLAPVSGQPQLLGALLMREQAPSGLGHAQLLLLSAAGISTSLLARSRVQSAAFTLLAALMLPGGLLGVLGLVGAIDPTSSLARPLVAAWMLGLAACLITGALLLDREPTGAGPQREPRVHARDAASILGVGIALVVACISVLAHDVPQWYWLSSAASAGSPEPKTRAIGFLMNAGVLIALSLLLDQRNTTYSRAFASSLRWLTPIHVLGSLTFLESIDAYDARPVWLMLLALTSLALATLSVWQQWKPFLLSALVGIAVAYVRLFSYAEELFPADGTGNAPAALRVGLTIGAIAAGATIVAAAWLAPAKAIAHRLARWRRLQSFLRSSGRSGNG